MSAANKTWLARYWPLLMVLGLGLGISAWLGVSEHRKGRRLDEQRFQVEARQMAAALEMSMERYEERLARFADHCAAVEELPPAVWSFRNGRVIDLNGNLPGVMLALYCPKIGAEEFHAHAERGRAIWAESYIFDPKRNGRTFALPVWQQWNRAGVNPVPRGTDMSITKDGLPVLTPALGKASAWSDSRPATVPRVNGQNINGFWFGIPFYAFDQVATRSQRSTESLEQYVARTRAHATSVAKGVLAVFLSTDYLIDESANGEKWPTRVHVRLYSQREPASAALLNPVSIPPAQPRHRQTIVLPWYGQRWCLEMTSTALFEAESAGAKAWMIGVGGTGFTLFAAMLIGLSIRARTRQERLTADITEARNTLADTERERASLGDDLHDGAVQSLYAIQLGMTRTARDVADALPGAARVLDETRHRVDVVIAELRQFIRAATRRSADEAPQLEHVLASVVQSLRATTLAELSLETEPGAAAHLTAPQSVALAQLARSALGNALRHSESSRISVRFAREGEEVVLTVQDNGKGFVVAEREGAGEGIRSMRQRAQAAGGVLTIESAVGRGTSIEVRLRFARGDGTTDAPDGGRCRA